MDTDRGPHAEGSHPLFPKFFSRFDARLAQSETRYGIPRVAIAIGVVAQLASFVLYSYNFYLPPDKRWTDTVSILSANPFTTQPVGEPQVRHRILGPLLAYVLGLRDHAGYLVWFAATGLAVATIYALLRREGIAQSTSAVIAGVMATTSVVTISQTHIEFPDSLAFLFIALAMYVGRAGLVAPLLLLAALTDERALLAIPLLILWRCTRTFRPDTIWRSAAACAAASAAWLALYALMAHHFGFTPGKQLSVAGAGFSLKAVALYIPNGAYYAFRAAWLLPLVLCVRELRSSPLLTLALTVSIAIASASVLVVLDTSRATTFAFPALLYAATRLRQSNHRLLPLVAAMALLLNVGTPAYFVFGSEMVWLKPLPVSLIFAILGIRPIG
jgi:hypothetical protein